MLIVLVRVISSQASVRGEFSMLHPSSVLINCLQVMHTGKGEAKGQK